MLIIVLRWESRITAAIMLEIVKVTTTMYKHSNNSNHHQYKFLRVPQSSAGPLPHERKCLASSLHVVAGILRENCQSTSIGNSGSESNIRNTSAATAAVAINSAGVDDILFF